MLYLSYYYSPFIIQDNVYIVDQSNNRVRKVSASTGTITTIAGSGAYAYNGDNGPATEAALLEPSSVAVDSSGKTTEQLPFIVLFNKYNLN